MIHCLHLRTNVYAIESCVMLRLWLLLMFIDSIMAYVSLIWSCIHLVIARPDLLKVNTFLKKLPQLWTNLHDKYVTSHHFYEQYVQHWIIFSIFDAIFATKINIWKKHVWFRLFRQCFELWYFLFTSSKIDQQIFLTFDHIDDFICLSR